MSTSRPYHHKDLAAALVRAALELLQEVEVSALSLRMVARRAGVSPMAPYRHYADKDALLAAVAEHGFRQLERRLLAADQVASGEDRLIAQGLAYVHFAQDERALFKLMFGPLIGPLEKHPALREASNAAFAVLKEGVASERPQMDAHERQVHALARWSLAHGLASLIVDGRMLPPDGPDDQLIAKIIGEPMNGKPRA
jgi:AcrR family transcriptional regulator